VPQPHAREARARGERREARGESRESRAARPTLSHAGCLSSSKREAPAQSGRFGLDSAPAQSEIGGSEEKAIDSEWLLGQEIDLEWSLGWAARKCRGSHSMDRRHGLVACDELVET
jgi:hypothetical protein